MKSLLYVSFGNVNTPGRGVSKKIDGQIGVFQGNGYKCAFVSGYDNGILVRDNDGKEQIFHNDRQSVRRQICNWCIKNAEQIGYVYIRFQFFDPLVYRMLHVFKKYNAAVVMEIPTYPYEDELRIQGIKGKPKLLVDRLYRNRCAELIDRFTCPLYDKPIMGTQMIHIRNGIDTTHISVRTPKKDHNRIRLLAVASMSRWHGFERLIEGLHQYSMGEHKKEIIFNVVGEGVELDKYQALVKQYALENCVIFWGRRYGAELEKVYDESDIGISSLGMHRLNTEVSNPLKTVEYLAKGMPVVCEDGEVSISSDNPYRCTVPFDDSPIEIGDLIRFYEKVYIGKDPEQVVHEIRTLCEKTCSMESAMKPVVDFYNSKK